MITQFLFIHLSLNCVIKNTIVLPIFCLVRINNFAFRRNNTRYRLSFNKWGDVFGDSVIANAIIDRLVHHCDVIKITGMSYRIKGKAIFEEEVKESTF